MKFEEIRNQAFEANMKIPENHLALYTWGNVSAFDKKEGVFATLLNYYNDIFI